MKCCSKKSKMLVNIIHFSLSDLLADLCSQQCGYLQLINYKYINLFS